MQVRDTLLADHGRIEVAPGEPAVHGTHTWMSDGVDEDVPLATSGRRAKD